MVIHHDRRLHELMWHLHDRIGLENIVVTAKEVNFLKGSNVVCQPDIVAVDKRGQLYVVEYKGGQNMEHKARRQLDAAERFIYDHFGLPIKKIYVHGDNVSQEIE